MKERRKDYIMLSDEIKNIDMKIEIMKSRYESEFGNNRTQGNMYRHLDDIKQTVVRQNSRIARLENWRWAIAGGLAIVSMAITISFPVGMGMLNNIRDDIKMNTDKVVKHVSHPQYHEKVATEISWIKNRLGK